MKSLLIILFTVLIVANTHAEKLWVQTKLPKESHEQYDLLRCLDSNNCYVIGDLNDRIILYKSTDQGISWSEIFEKYDNEDTGLLNVLNCKMTDSNNIYIYYSDKLALEKSSDGGKTFETLLFGELSERKYERFFDITFYSKDISAGVTRSSLIYTFDNWNSNTIVQIPDSIFSIDPIFFIDSNSIAFLRHDYYNTDFISYNVEEQDWSVWSRGTLAEEEFEDIVNIQFVNDTLGYGCGSQFTGVADLSEDIIWKTTNRGKSWTKLMHQLNEPEFGLRDISFRNELHGIAVGNWGKILETTNGGESWFQFPVQEEMIKPGYRVTWAGSIPLIVAWNIGIFRLETISEVEVLSSDEKFRVFQSGHNLEIAINDESHATYSFSLYNSSGQSLVTRKIKSSFGFVFEPVELIDLTNGVYYYTISKNNGVEFTGKLVVVE